MTNRRSFVLGLFITASLLCASRTVWGNSEINTYTKTDFAMDTVVSETLYTTGEDITADIISALKDVEENWISWTKESSQIYQINQNAGNTTTVSDETATCLKQILDLSKASGGAMDPTMGRMIRLWDIDGENPHIPSDDELNSMLENVGYGKVTLDGNKVTMPKGVTLDLGAAGKGIGCDAAKKVLDADKNAIKIALTGTPLLKEERESWRVFGNYLHTYYYDKSILDGYTLKIIREDIETQYKERLSEIYEKLETLVEKKDVKKNQIVEHDNYVKELLRYIITDLKRFRQIQGDNTLGGMIICETSEQARKLFAYFDEIQNELNKTASLKSNLKAGLILYDSDDKDTRDTIVNNFKKNMTVDILIVFNMLLTGFDAPRLKRLYFGRKLKDHNLLQAITRVNRPYKDNRYGYVIDFADIKRNFDETNAAYLKELNRFNDPNEVGKGNEMDTFKQVIEDPQELIQQMQEVQQVLFNYTTDNAEAFSTEISTIEDKQELLKLKKILIAARDCCNLVRTFGDDELKETFARMELTKLPSLISEVQHHIDNINQKELFASDDTTKLLVNEAMEDITFNFSKISEEELKIVGGKENVTEKYRKTVRAFTQNIDPDDPEFMTLQEAFLLRFKEHGFEPKSITEIEEQGKELEEILKKLDELQKKNNVLLRKYNGDAKFARVHKRIREENLARKAANKQPIVSEYDASIMDVLKSIKSDIDQKVYDRNDILKKDAYFEQTVMTQIKLGIDRLGIASARDDRKFIQSRITKQYLDQYNQTYSVA